MTPGDLRRWRKLERLNCRHRAANLALERDALRTEMILFAKTHTNVGADRVVFEGLNQRLKYILAEHATLRATIARLDYEINQV
jgi:hypothetical protein